MATYRTNGPSGARTPWATTCSRRSSPPTRSARPEDGPGAGSRGAASPPAAPGGRLAWIAAHDARCLFASSSPSWEHRSEQGRSPIASQIRGGPMADRALLITWGMVVRGREERPLENFNEVVGLYGRMQQDGRIESFDVSLLMPNGSIDGFIQLRGSAEQLAAVREDQDFQRTLAESSLIVDDIRVIDGFVEQGVAAQMELYRAAIAKVPQTA